MNKFKNKSVLITGGTGSFGKNLAYYLSKNFSFRKIIIFSRDELKQFNFQQELGNKLNNFRFLIGDVRDKDRLFFAFRDVDYVIHAAALKQIPSTEYNPFECIKTNVLGAQNIVECALQSNVKKVISLSTDKAVSPINLYGAAKLCSDKLFVSANQLVGNKKILFSVVRYGNVLGSRGSILPKLLKQNEESSFFTITHRNMTRFNITIKEAIDTVMWTLENAIGGEIVVPKLSSYKILDFVSAINNKKKIKFIGIRPGEKIHEEMISINDSAHAVNTKKYYLILPYDKNKFMHKYKKEINFLKKQKQFSYNSLENDYLKVSELKKIIKNQIGNRLIEY